MNAFQTSVAHVLEVDAIGLDDDFRQVDGWCSLHGFGLIVLLNNTWGASLDAERFLQMRTVRDLYREAFLAFAANLLGVKRDALTGATKYASIPQWDSVNHLRLVMEAEKRFGVSFPLERIPFLTSFDDFLI